MLGDFARFLDVIHQTAASSLRTELVRILHVNASGFISNLRLLHLYSRDIPTDEAFESDKSLNIHRKACIGKREANGLECNLHLK